MSSDQKKALGAVGRGEVFFFDPDDLTIVSDKAHYLYDERIELPIDEGMVLNIMHQGVLETCLIERDGDRKLVVDGRQRVRCASEANRRLKKQGCKPINVPCLLKRGDAAAMLGMMISTNEIRRDDSPMVKGRKAQRFIDNGNSIEQAALIFGVGVQSIKNWIALLDCAPVVQKAVEGGDLPAEAARKLAKLPKAEQKTALDEMRAKGATKGRKAKAAADKATGAKPADKTSMMGRKEIAGLILKLRASEYDGGYTPAEFAAMTLEYVLGRRDEYETDHAEIFKS